MIAAGTHNAQEHGRSIALWAAALSSGNVVSPVLGGLVVKLKWGSDPTANWRWAFILVIALGLLSLVVSAVFAENSSAPEGRSLDWPGQFTIAISLFGLLFAIIQAPTAGWESAEVIIGFLVAAVFMALFIAAERRSRAPLLRRTGSSKTRALAPTPRRVVRTESLAAPATAENQNSQYAWRQPSPDTSRALWHRRLIGLLPTP